MEEIVKAVLSKTLELSKDYIDLDNGDQVISEIITTEFSIIKKDNGIKILDGESDFDLDDGVFVYLSTVPFLLTVKNNKSSRKKISADMACDLLALSYIVRILALSTKNEKSKIRELTKEINSLVATI